MDDPIFVCCKSTRVSKASRMTTAIIFQIFSRFKKKSVPIIALKCLPQQRHANSRASCDGPESKSKRKVSELLLSIFNSFLTEDLLTPYYLGIHSFSDRRVYVEKCIGRALFWSAPTAMEPFHGGVLLLLFVVPSVELQSSHRTLI